MRGALFSLSVVADTRILLTCAALLVSICGRAVIVIIFKIKKAKQKKTFISDGLMLAMN